MSASNLLSFLSSTELFQGVDLVVLGELAAGMKVVSLRDGDILVHQGNRGRSLYIILEGRLHATGRNFRSEPRDLFDLEAGESACEMDLLSSDASSTTVSALGPTELLELPREVFASFLESHPREALRITQALGKRLHKLRLVTALCLGPIFDGLEPDVIHDLKSELELFTLYGGETLFQQGDPGSYLCFVISGNLRVTVHRKGVPLVVAHLGHGEIVGEMGVVTGEPRTATVEAIRDTQLARLSGEAYSRLVVRHPAWAVQLVSRKLAERLKDTTAGRSQSRRAVSTIAVVPVQSSAPAHECCRALASALAKYGPTMHLTSSAVDEHLGHSGTAQVFERGGANIRLSQWLSELELEYRYVLYEADPRSSPWTERSIRQADHILLVGDAQGAPDRGEIETDILDQDGNRLLAHQWLVLVHHNGTSPTGTRHWLDTRHVERHLHVRLSQDADFDRLARLLTCRGIGLTLGGGFARGMAHLGIFRAMAELGLNIDALGGASMGAMIGALWAMGWDSERILKEITAACAGAFGDLTFPFLAFKTGRRFSTAVRALFGDLQIEDLWVPYFCISANLNRAELKIHTRGSLAKAILAATRAPGVFPPVIYEGELHVDGGVVNNVPVDLMRSFSNDGFVFGVDVSPPHELHYTADYGDQVSGWRAFWKRWKNRSTKSDFMPSILLVMIRTMEFTGIAYKNERIKFADIYMYPEVLKFKRTDFHLSADIAQAGYDSALTSLRQWLATSEQAAARRPDLCRQEVPERIRAIRG
jgi:predicted acylesterase/phospholipase RssA/CRP-like cAMP-binding protein